MTNINELIIHLKKQRSGSWIAATGTSPYFYFEASSEREVRLLAARGLRFYTRTLELHGGELPREPVTFEDFADNTHTVKASELLAA